ncbi:MAG TPA: hypothetical protein VGR13_02775 [Actinomycetota bacterium]|nr:hypothetical protein [Actinomycetota bacterium]
MSYDVWAALIVGPLLLLLSLPILARQAAREQDRLLFWLLVAALVLKLAGGLARHVAVFDIYDKADARAYHQVGLELANSFRSGDFSAIPRPLSDTNFVGFTTGVIYAIVGPSALSGFMVFSWLGFWGVYFIYRAFRLAVPEGRGRTYAGLLFFLPSILFWPSSIGKEALMMLGIGVAGFGAARILTGKMARGLVSLGLGLWLTWLIRPHVAAFIGLALVAAYIIRRPGQHLGQLAPLAKLVALAGLVTVAVLLVRDVDRFLHQSRVETTQGVEAITEQITLRTQSGGSEFAPHPIVTEPEQAPLAAFTVLFRPLVTEAHNIGALAASLETSFLLLLSLVRLPWLMSAVGSMRRQPYVMFAVAFVALSIAALSIVANFGLLARQRSVMIPLYLVLFAVPPRRQKERVAHPTRWEAVPA